MLNTHKYNAGVYGFFLLAGTIGLILMPSQILVHGSAASHHPAVRGDYFPRILLILIIIISIIGIITEIIKVNIGESHTRVGFGNFRSLAYAGSIISSYVISFTYLGFIVSSCIHIPLLMAVFGVCSLAKILAVTSAFTVIMYLMFHYLLRMSLPTLFIF